MMDLYKILFVCFSLFFFAECVEKPGVQMRLTKKGMQYAIDIGKSILQKELKTKSFDESGSSGKVQYRLSGLRITESSFTNTKVSPVSNVGIGAVFSGISLGGRGNVWYKYKRGWFKFSDNVDVSVSIRNVYIALTLSLTNSKGHPVIGLPSCSSNVGSVKLHFHNGFKGWIYNLFSGIVEKQLKKALNKMLCKLVRKEINTKAREELETFPVVKRLDKWAEIDYSLAKSPVFTSDYMDAFFKGEFMSSTHPKKSELVPATISPPSVNDKMLYFWVTNYTINTAGEVYQGSNQFDVEIRAWDTKVPKDIRKSLNTKLFAIVIPNLSKYADLPMSVRLVPFKPPRVKIDEDKMHLFLYADSAFSVKKKDGTIVPVFQIRFNIDATFQVHVVNGTIGGKISEFNYDAKITKSNIGKIETPLDSLFIKMIVDSMIIKKANVPLQRGFPLPQIENVSLRNLDIKLRKGYIQVGSDVSYKNIL